MEAYLDIETSFDQDISIFGVYRKDKGMLQLIGNKVSAPNVLTVLNGVSTIYTYNGSRFDLPVIKRVLALDLKEDFASHDLMYDCWKKNLYGGLKGVEKQLGIERKLEDIDGYAAMQLWYQYDSYGDEEALRTLLVYNEEDVRNLIVLRRRLRSITGYE